MLSKWLKLTVTDCEVVELSKNFFVFPIFKNGRSSIQRYVKKNNFKTYYNKEIKNLKNIKVFLRDPTERFVSGVHTFDYLNNQKISKNTLKEIENCKIVDRHFVPQYIWLLHLSKFYKGSITINPVIELYNLIPNRDGPWLSGIPWKPLDKKTRKKILEINFQKYTNIDNKVIEKYMHQSVKIETLIREFKNVLSSS